MLLVSVHSACKDIETLFARYELYHRFIWSMLWKERLEAIAAEKQEAELRGEAELKKLAISIDELYSVLSKCFVVLLQWYCARMHVEG